MSNWNSSVLKILFWKVVFRVSGGNSDWHSVMNLFTELTVISAVQSPELPSSSVLPTARHCVTSTGWPKTATLIAHIFQIFKYLDCFIYSVLRHTSAAFFLNTCIGFIFINNAKYLFSLTTVLLATYSRRCRHLQELVMSLQWKLTSKINKQTDMKPVLLTLINRSRATRFLRFKHMTNETSGFTFGPPYRNCCSWHTSAFPVLKSILYFDRITHF